METVRIDLLGTAFTIQTDETRDYVRRLVSILERRLETVKERTGLVDPVKISLVAGLFLVDELIRTDGCARTDEEEIERRASRLIDRLDDSLKAADIAAAEDPA